MVDSSGRRQNLDDLRTFSACFHWAYLVPDQEGQDIKTFCKGDKIVDIPAYCLPTKGSLDYYLSKDKPWFPVLWDAGVTLVEHLDDWGSNFDESLLIDATKRDCQDGTDIEPKIVGFVPEDNSLHNIDYDLKVKLVDSNYK